MKPNSLSLALSLLCGTSVACFADTIVTGDVTTELGPDFFLDATSTGGSDFTVNQPGIANFDRSFGTLSTGTEGSTITVTGIGWATSNSPSLNDATSVSVTITYLGQDGVFGGSDDVLIGTVTDDFTFAANGEYYWRFAVPVSNTIDGLNNMFRVAVAPSNGLSAGSLNFKTIGAGTAPNTKVSVAGTSALVGSPLADLDMDGIFDVYETGTGIYVSSFDTGTDPGDDDTDGDGLKDGEEVNGETISGFNYTSNPNVVDSDNDTIGDGDEVNGTFNIAFLQPTNPGNRDTDNDGLGDKYELANGLDPRTNADFDNDTFSDFDEVRLYGSLPKDDTSFPGDGINPAVGSFTAIEDAGTTDLATADLTDTLGTAIINEASIGGNVDADFSTGVTSFVVHYPDAFPAAGSAVSITGFAWPVVAVAPNASGDILLQFFDPGADGIVDGIDQDTLVGTAKGTLIVTGVTTVMYWNFDTPIDFTSSGTGLMVKIQSTSSLRIKAQDNFASGIWYANDGLSTFGNIRASRFSIGGTAVAPALPKFLSITRTGTMNTVTWDLNGAASVTLQRGTALDDFADVPGKINTTDTSHSENSSDPKAFFRLSVP